MSIFSYHAILKRKYLKILQFKSQELNMISVYVILINFEKTLSYFKSKIQTENLDLGKKLDFYVYF